MPSTFRPLKMRSLRCLETSASSYPVMRRHMPEERKTHMSKCYIKPGRPKTRTPGTVTTVKRCALGNVGSWEQLIRLVTKASPVPDTTGCRTNISSACNNRLFGKNYRDSRVGRVSSVGTATRYGPDGPGIKSRLGARFSAPAQTVPGAHPASYTMGTRSLPGVKRPGRGVDHPSHLAPRLKKE